MITDQNDNNATQLQEFKNRIIEKYIEFSNIYFSYRAIMGFAADGIIDYAKDNEMNLIVLGIRGETNSIDRMIGSVASKVIKRSKIPVLGIPEHAAYHSIRNIGYATDFNEQDINLLLKTKALFGELVNYEMIHINTDQPIVKPTKDKPFSDKKIIELQQELLSMNLDNVRITLEHYPNFVGGVEQVFKKEKIDLLVMLHKKKGLFGFLKGSDSSEAAFTLNNPVLIFYK